MICGLAGRCHLCGPGGVIRSGRLKQATAAARESGCFERSVPWRKEPTDVSPYLAPIDRPKGLRLKLLYWFLGRRFEIGRAHV